MTSSPSATKQLNAKLSPFGVTKKGLDALFPFHLAMDAEENFISIGPVINRAYQFGSGCFSDHFEFIKPQVKFDLQEFSDRRSETFFARCRTCRLSLKGQFLCDVSNQTAVFLCFPWIQQVKDLENMPFQAIDFPVFDSTIDFVFLLQSQISVLEETNKKEKELIAIKAAKDEAEKHYKSLKLAQAQLIQAAKLSSLGTMAAGVAHELNNPLTGVKGFANLLYKRVHDQDKRKILKKIINSATRMQGIVDHLRSFARESKADDWQTIDVIAVVQAAFDLLGAQLRDSGISFAVNCSGPVFIEGDHNQLESVFQNLIVNSRDAFDEVKDRRKKKIAVEFAHPNDKQINIRYQDNATGIPMDVIEKIFDPFFTTKKEGHGTGLGMSISKGIVDEHGGTISVSTLPGKGTTFALSFPVVEKIVSPTAKITNTPRKAPTFANEPRPTILIVDNEEDICELLREFLEEDFNTMTTTDPAHGLQLIEKRQHDLVITDLKMPEVSGIEIINHQRLIDPDIPAVIISGHARTDKDLTDAMQKGAAGLITKPFADDEELRATLWSYLAGSKYKMCL